MYLAQLHLPLFIPSVICLYISLCSNVKPHVMERLARQLRGELFPTLDILLPTPNNAQFPNAPTPAPPKLVKSTTGK